MSLGKGELTSRLRQPRGPAAVASLGQARPALAAVARAERRGIDRAARGSFWAIANLKAAGKFETSVRTRGVPVDRSALARFGLQMSRR